MEEAALREVGLPVEEEIVLDVYLLCQLLEEVILDYVLPFLDQVADGNVGVLQVEVETGRGKGR